MLFSVSCTPDRQRLDAALEAAGDNRAELEKVLRHYKGDTLKYRAARFLIENMPYHTYYVGKELEKYKKYFICFPLTRKTPAELMDSLKEADGAFFMGSLYRKRTLRPSIPLFGEEHRPCLPGMEGAALGAECDLSGLLRIHPSLPCRR